jgi:hypothetical protein
MNLKYEPAAQNFWITHPEHGITFDAEILADRSASKGKTEWASISK